MNPTILNRDFQHPSDGWYQIEPRGEHPNQAAGVVQVIDAVAADSIVNRFNAAATASALRHGNELLIDHEHFSDQPDKESRAYGWLQELQNRADGIYGRIRWTTTGKAAVDGGDYRFFSTEYDPADIAVINSTKGMRRIRPIRLSGLSLTNMNNNRGQKPITNRIPTFAGARAPADITETNQQPRKKMKSVCTLLGLSAEADESSVHAAVTKLMNRGDATPSELIVLRNRADITPAALTELQTANTTLLDEQIAADLATHKVTDEKVINRLIPVLKGMKNRADRVAFLTDCVKAAAKPATAETTIRNRGASAPACGTETETDDAAKADKIRNRATELQHATPARSWDSCWNQAQTEAAK
jgi:phage I-like protein